PHVILPRSSSAHARQLWSSCGSSGEGGARNERRSAASRSTGRMRKRSCNSGVGAPASSQPAASAASRTSGRASARASSTGGSLGSTSNRDGRARREQHVGDAQVRERSLSLLEEEDPFRRCPVVVASPSADARPVERGLRPDDFLPVDESGLRAARAAREPLLADSLLLLDDV